MRGFIDKFKKRTSETGHDGKDSMLRLVWPIFIEMILTMLVGNADQYMVSSYSENAVGAIGNANQIINLLMIMFTVISMSTTILVSQYIGSNSRSKLPVIYTLSLSVNLIFSLIISIIIGLFTGKVFRLMKVPGEILADASAYIKLVGGFIFLQGMISVFSSIFRANRMMKESMLISVVINLVNIAGNALLINGAGIFPALGTTGAAISTNISRFAGLILFVILFIRKFDTKLSIKALKPFPRIELSKLLSIGIPSGGEALSYSMSMTFIMTTINTFGTHAINTKVLASTLAWFSFMYAISVGQASQVMIGNYMGAGQIARVNKRVMKTLRDSVLVAFLMSSTMYIFSDVLFGLFSADPMVLELGKKIMLIDIVLQLGKSANITLVRSLQATGDIKYPMTIGIVSMWALAFGLGFLLGVVFDMGLIGIWIGMALDEDVRAIIFYIRWRKGNWKHIRLAD